MTDEERSAGAERTVPMPDWSKGGLVKVGVDWGKLIPNPRPVVRFDRIDGKLGVEIGIKWTF